MSANLTGISGTIPFRARPVCVQRPGLSHSTPLSTHPEAICFPEIRTPSLISRGLNKFTGLLRKPLTQDRVFSAKMLWASILSVGVTLESVVAGYVIQDLSTLYRSGSYYSLAASFVLGLQTMALMAVCVVPTLFHGIRAALSRDALPPPPQPGDLPTVTIQIPARNEPFEVMRDRSLKSALENRSNYPLGKLAIQVIDNSEQGKYTDLERYCMEKGIQFIHRDGLPGGKSHNLNLGTGQVETDYVFITDADISLPHDALRTVMGEFTQKPDLSFVVVEAETKNLAGDKHIFAKILERTHNQSSFMVQALDDNGLSPLAGYSTAINTQHLRKVGGWSETHVGEDYEMGIRLAVKLGTRGKRVSYLKAEDPALIDIDRYRTQQYRWSFGTIQTLRDYAGPLLRSPALSWHEKAAIMYRLSYYPSLAFLFTIPTLLAAPLAILAKSEENQTGYQHSISITAMRWLALLSFPLAFSLKNMVQEGKISRFWDGFKKVYAGILTGSGVLLETTKACLNALIYKNDYFRVTPKGKLNAVSLGQTLRRNKFEFALAACFITPLLLGSFAYTWAAFIGAGIIASPLISWYSNRRTQ